VKAERVRGGSHQRRMKMDYLFYFIIVWFFIGFLSILRISYWMILCKIKKIDMPKINSALDKLSIKERILASIGIIVSGPIVFYYLDKIRSN
jgi:hypothetical protein